MRVEKKVDVILCVCLVSAACSLWVAATQTYRTHQAHITNLWMEDNHKMFLDAEKDFIKSVRDCEAAFVSKIGGTLDEKTAIYAEDAKRASLALKKSQERLEETLDRIGNIPDQVNNLIKDERMRLRIRVPSNRD